MIDAYDGSYRLIGRTNEALAQRHGAPKTPGARRAEPTSDAEAHSTRDDGIFVAPVTYQADGRLAEPLARPGQYLNAVG